MKFIWTKINKVGLTMHSWLFMGIHFAVNDPPEPNSTSTRTINVCLMNPDIYTISCVFITLLWISKMSLVSIVSWLTEKLYNFSILSSFFHVIFLSLFKYFQNTTKIYFRVLCFELTDFNTNSVQKPVHCILVWTQTMTHLVRLLDLHQELGYLLFYYQYTFMEYYPHQ